ncbi:hypothetical protein B0J17DRAFT_660915 [Rhizoctonia solani]|nr:hypothetical protein B0J17DRAFT_660915 [Rhizoctonia solani]
MGQLRTSHPVPRTNQPSHNVCQPILDAPSDGASLGKSLVSSPQSPHDGSLQVSVESSVEGHNEHRDSDDVSVPSGAHFTTRGHTWNPGAIVRSESSPGGISRSSVVSNSFDNVPHLAPAQSAGTIEATHDPTHDSGRNPSPGLNTPAPTNNPSPESTGIVDPFQIYEIGRTLCSFARNLIAERAGSSQSHVLDSFPIPPSIISSLPPHLAEQGLHPPIPDNHLHPQLQLSEPDRDEAIPNDPPRATANIQQLHPDPAILLNPHFAFEESQICHNNHSNSMPSSVIFDQSAAEAHFVNDAATSGSDIDDNPGPENPILPGSEPAAGSSTTTVPRPRPGSTKNTCPECGKRCRRASDLQDHMHSHDRIKRHACEFCGSPFAFRNNMSTHKKTCKFNPGL